MKRLLFSIIGALFLTASVSAGAILAGLAPVVFNDAACAGHSVTNGLSGMGPAAVLSTGDEDHAAQPRRKCAFVVTPDCSPGVTGTYDYLVRVSNERVADCPDTHPYFCDITTSSPRAPPLGW